MRQKGATVHSITLTRGFTIVELTVVIVIMALLLGLAIDTSINYQVKSRDSERVADVEVMSAELERYFRTEAVATGATYPPTTVGTSGLATIIKSPESLIAPDQTSSSLSIAATSSDQTPTISQYIYQPLNLDGTLCTTAPCVRFNIYYRLEEDNIVTSLASMRQQ
jgi:prepilin-type N-terminal cleavage/methylation domain-containing protein